MKKILAALIILFLAACGQENDSPAPAPAPTPAVDSEQKVAEQIKHGERKLLEIKVALIPEASNFLAYAINNKLSKEEITEKLALIESNGTARSHDWKSLGNKGSYFDKNFDKSDKKIAVWLLIDELPEALRKGKLESSLSAKQLFEIDCQKHTYRYIAGLHYREHMGKGLPAEPIYFSNAQPEKINPNSNFGVVETLCKKRDSSSNPAMN